MFWPRFRLTPEEHKFNGKYEGEFYIDPVTKIRHSKPNVLRRIYYGQINLNPTVRQDNTYFQISRRARIMAMTASGDVNQIEIQIQDVTGEQYTTDFIPIIDLIGGANWDPRSVGFFNAAVETTAGLNTGNVYGAMTYTPLVFEPNIVTAPNQTISINGRFVDPSQPGPLHASICFHVWEFPGMPGSPL